MASSILTVNKVGCFHILKTAPLAISELLLWIYNCLCQTWFYFLLGTEQKHYRQNVIQPNSLLLPLETQVDFQKIPLKLKGSVPKR